MKKRVDIEFKHHCVMDSDTGLDPSGRRWNLRFYDNYVPTEIAGDLEIIKVFLIFIVGVIEFGMFYWLHWYWLIIQAIVGIVISYLIIKANKQEKARINRFAIRMHKKYGVPHKQAIAYFEENHKYLTGVYAYVVKNKK